MFSRIAGRYDLLNRLLSFNADQRWRRKGAAALGRVEGRTLDLATGTGDLMIEIRRRGNRTIGADFCLDMLAEGQKKGAVPATAADALRLPFPDESFSAVTAAFGVRNFANIGEGLAEIRRVLAPRGKILILEFSQPTGPWGAFYRFYSGKILPRLGGLVSGDAAAYRYLNCSARAWPDRQKFSATLSRAGFRDIKSLPLSFGIVALHEGIKG